MGTGSTKPVPLGLESALTSVHAQLVLSRAPVRTGVVHFTSPVRKNLRDQCFVMAPLTGRVWTAVLHLPNAETV